MHPNVELGFPALLPAREAAWTSTSGEADGATEVLAGEQQPSNAIPPGAGKETHLYCGPLTLRISAGGSLLTGEPSKRLQVTTWAWKETKSKGKCGRDLGRLQKVDVSNHPLVSRVFWEVQRREETILIQSMC